MKVLTTEQLVLIRRSIQHRIDQLDSEDYGHQDEETRAEYEALKQLLVYMRYQSAPCKQPRRRVVRVSEPTAFVKPKIVH